MSKAVPSSFYVALSSLWTSYDYFHHERFLKSHTIFGWVFKNPLRTSYDEMGNLKRVSIIDIFFVISMKTPDMIDRELNQHFLPLKLQAMDRLRVIRSKTVWPTDISSTCRPIDRRPNDMVRDVLTRFVLAECLFAKCHMAKCLLANCLSSKCLSA